MTHPGSIEPDPTGERTPLDGGELQGNSEGKIEPTTLTDPTSPAATPATSTTGEQPDGPRQRRPGVRRTRQPIDWSLGLMWLPREQRNFLAIATTVGALFLAMNLIFLAADPMPHARVFTVIVLVTAFSLIFGRGIEVNRGSERMPQNFWEYPTILGLALAPSAPYVVITAIVTVYGAATVIAALMERRDYYKYPAYFAFGVIAATIGGYIAVIWAPWTFLVGFCVATVIFDALFLVNDITRTGKPAEAWALWVDGWLRRMSLPFVIALAVTAIIIAFGPSKTVIALGPALLLLGFWAWKWRTRLSEQQNSWAKFESLPSTLSGLDVVPHVISELLRAGLDIFGCDRIDIVIEDAPSITEWSRDLGEGSQVRATPVQRLPTPLDPVPRHALRVPLVASDNTLGYLTIYWPEIIDATQSPQAGFARVFGHYAASSIANARHNSRISLQAAEKAREAQVDPLTGLGNRGRLYEVGPGVLDDSRGLITHTALLLLDVDGFKDINDSLGHAAGDAVIVEIGKRIKAVTRREDYAIRLGGDEFAVLTTDMARGADATKVARKIANALAEPIDVLGIALSVEFSIGIAIYNDTETIDDLLKHADIAMYEAKNQGKGRSVVYSPEMDQNNTETLALATDLRTALTETDQLVLHYQPQVSLASGKVVGLEALIRWQHPERGLLSPNEFVPLAEQSGLVRQFTLYVIDRALRDRKAMRATFPNATVSVNLSRRNLLDQGLAADISRALRVSDVAPEELVLEVTETAAAHEQHSVDQVLHDLRDLGCALAMDDFGSGYATFESLHNERFPISEIKIDRTFIKSLDTSARDKTLAEAMVSIARALGCRVVAEGVENEAVMDALRDMGCDAAQGFHILRPAPLADVLAWGAAREG